MTSARRYLSAISQPASLTARQPASPASLTRSLSLAVPKHTTLPLPRRCTFTTTTAHVVFVVQPVRPSA